MSLVGRRTDRDVGNAPNTIAYVLAGTSQVYTGYCSPVRKKPIRWYSLNEV